jgi:Leucine-rich repeat (LRR) protein
LEELVISNNVLSDIPDTIGKLTRLQSLVLDGNEIGYLPDSIGSLGNLTNLYTVLTQGIEQEPFE